tara:strand:+ start:197 stop:370 length:174 start_codon:yes stop_codon:yes gene_type:complete
VGNPDFEQLAGIYRWHLYSDLVDILAAADGQKSANLLFWLYSAYVLAGDKSSSQRLA